VPARRGHRQRRAPGASAEESQLHRGTKFATVGAIS
jgi:hypothetical protein